MGYLIISPSFTDTIDSLLFIKNCSFYNLLMSVTFQILRIMIGYPTLRNSSVLIFDNLNDSYSKINFTTSGNMLF